MKPWALSIVPQNELCMIWNYSNSIVVVVVKLNVTIWVEDGGGNT